MISQTRGRAFGPGFRSQSLLLATILTLLLIGDRLVFAQGGASSFSSTPKDRTSYSRPALAEDFSAARGQGAGGAGPLLLVDVVVQNTDPNLNATDTFGDEEPSIAINPANANEIVILAFSGFWGANAPWFHSTNGGVTWSKEFTIPAPVGLGLAGPEDQAPDYGRNNQLAAVFLASDTNNNTDVYSGITTDPSNPAVFNWPLVGGVAVHANLAGIGACDQPWLLVNPDPNVPSRDNVYVAYDDFSGSPDMRVSVSPGGNPPSFTTDRLVGFSGGAVNPGQRLAKDPRTGYLYSLFQRNIAAGAGGSKNINFMLNRTTDGGLTWGLNGNPTGIIVANADSTQPTPKFGTVNALLGGVDHAAVDPNNGDVYYVYGNRDPGTRNNRLSIRRLTNNSSGGLDIGPEVFVTDQVQAALPSVAVNTVGVIGVLYDTFDGFSSSGYPMFSAHFATSTNQAASFSDLVLYSFLSAATNNPTDPRQRVFGDYQQLKAIGKTFYGVFTANGLQLGRPFANHDPIFFKITLDLPPAVTLQPTNETVFQGDTALMAVAAAGLPPLSYQWRFNNIAIPGATNPVLLLSNVQPIQAGSYAAVITNSSGSVTSSVAVLSVIPVVPLPFALNATTLTWSTDGDAIWHGLTNISHDGVAAGRSGPISDNQNSFLTTTVTGPGTLSFWWKVSSQAGADYLSFTIVGNNISNSTQISGEVDWNQQSYLLPSGVQTLQWAYSKDAALSAGSDSAWVDQVNFVPGFTLPYILSQPVAQSTTIGVGTSFSVTAGGTPPLTYQWRHNGLAIPGASGTSFTIASPGIADNGSYSVQIANPYGFTNSAAAVLTVDPLFASGDNSLGQINLPLPAANVISIAAGAWHNLALRSTGTIQAWGDNYNGQCGVPSNLNGVLALAGGGYHSLALKRDGTLVSWGDNSYGQTTLPVGINNVTAIACGTWHSLALRADGSVVAWGDNTSGQCAVPSGLANVVAIAAGGSHSLALRADGSVVAWGENVDALGNFVGQSIVPVGLSGVVAVGAGDYHSLAVKADGTFVAWGDNSEGQCQSPAGLSNLVAIVGGDAHSVALRADSTVLAWGNDWNGQCDIPAGASNVVQIAAGHSDSLLLEGNRFIPPQLLNAVRVGKQFRLVLQTYWGKNYTLEYKPTLSSASWSAATTIRGNGGLQLLIDSAALDAQRFYRVRQW